MANTNETAENLVALRQAEPPPLSANDVGDHQFIADLTKLKDLRSFLIEQAVPLNSLEGNLSFGPLNLLRFRQGGRDPTRDEWERLEFFTQELFRNLSDPLRRRFLYGRLPWWVATM